MKETIYTIMRLNNRKDGDVGIEVEVEGTNIPIISNDTWNTTHDGSLRSGLEGVEYVLRSPKSLVDAKKALDMISKAYKRNNAQILDSIYAGVHIHVNVQKLTVRQLYTYMTAYYILEEVLVSFCGPTREGNHFCLRGKDAEFGPLEVSRAAREKRLQILSNEDLRYGSMNPCSLFRYGSLEFRAMRSTTDFDAILKWAELLVNLRDRSITFNSPLDIVEFMSGDGATNFARQMLGENYRLFSSIPDFEDKIYNGARMAQQIAYAADWSEKRDVVVNPFKNKGEL